MVGQRHVRLETQGYCPVCARRSTFVAEHDWLRDAYLCVRCQTVPRQRALVAVLDMLRPRWPKLVLHESSPTLIYFGDRCRRYSYSQYLPGVEPGTYSNGVRCEDVHHLSFPDATFDLFITQDVLEHVFHPDRALAEIMRCVKPGGLHVFTTPKHKSLLRSERRAELRGGEIVHLRDPVYHGNPVGDGRTLVTWDYGADFEDLAQRWGGYLVSTYAIRDRNRGIDGEFLEVFVQTRDELNRGGVP
jgi:SAM-dependent methyltransferase